MSSLSIKNAEAHKLARALAKATGETMTRAVIEALRERLDRVRRGREPEARARDLLAIGRHCAEALPDNRVDSATLLYDERGIPR